MIAAAFVVVAGAYLVGGCWLLGRRRPGYSHARYTISELGETGAADARTAAWLLFAPVGCAMLAAAALAGRNGCVAACIAVDFLASAAFPCDPGAPAVGSTRQALHSLGGLVQYAGGALAFWRLGGPGFSACGVLVAAAGLALASGGRFRGLIQRVAEAVFFAGAAFAALG